MPNQHTKNPRRPRKYRVLDFVRDHPGSTTAQIAEHFVLDLSFISADLCHLRIDGSIASVPVPGKRIVTWIALDTNDGDDAPMIRRVSQSWEPHLVKCPLIWSLFGAPA